MRTVDQHALLFVFGTRPEAIKLMPVIRAFRAEADFNVQICITGQHRELVDPFLDSFDLLPDFDLDVMSPGQTVAGMSAKIIAGCESIMERLRPDLVFVQGDTTSALAAALAAVQGGFPVAHIEAGLRTHRKSSPFPEELNRTVIGHVARLHFAPSEHAADNLRCEGITQGVHVVGNTIVDALKLVLDTMPTREKPKEGQASADGPAKRKLVVTMHRRESFGKPLASVCAALRRIAQTHPDVEILFPVHPNPAVRQIVHANLKGIPNIRLLAPLPYAEFVRLLSEAALIISDSGGVLEEAETLGLPVLVAREVTERAEAISNGKVSLVGTDADLIFTEALRWLHSSPVPVGRNPPLRSTFGDGRAAARILRETRHHLLAGADAASFQPVALPTAA